MEKYRKSWKLCVFFVTISLANERQMLVNQHPIFTTFSYDFVKMHWMEKKSIFYFFSYNHIHSTSNAIIKFFANTSSILWWENSSNFIEKRKSFRSFHSTCEYDAMAVGVVWKQFGGFDVTKNFILLLNLELGNGIAHSLIHLVVRFTNSRSRVQYTKKASRWS